MYVVDSGDIQTTTNQTESQRLSAGQHCQMTSTERLVADIRSWLADFESASGVDRALLRVEHDEPVRLKVVGDSIPASVVMDIVSQNPNHRLVAVFSTTSAETQCVISFDPESITADDVEDVIPFDTHS